MLKEGSMARDGSGRMLKICSISNDVAECVWFDSRGHIHSRDYEMDQLQPIWLAARPRSLWPEINEMPDGLVAALEEMAAAKRLEKYKNKLEKSTKPRPSNKLGRPSKKSSLESYPQR